MRTGGKKKAHKKPLWEKKKSFSKFLQCDCSPGDQFLPSGSQGAVLKQWVAWRGITLKKRGRAPMRCPVGTDEVGQALPGTKEAAESAACAHPNTPCSTWGEDLTSPSSPGDLQVLFQAWIWTLAANNTLWDTLRWGRRCHEAFLAASGCRIEPS